jgi:sulfite dehydrogenase (cytochrome) subunit B
MKTRSTAALLLGTLLLSAAEQKDWRLPAETAKLKPAPGAELTAASCLLCHSADYVSTQPPLSRSAWKATVEKMRVRYGAPIPTNNIDKIADYLSANYGAREK